MSEILSAAEVRTLTGYTRAAEQQRMLSHSGIPFKTMGGRTIVMSQHVLAWVEGRPLRKMTQPNFDAIR